MNNIEKIKKAWAYGWSAVIVFELEAETNSFNVVNILKNRIVANNGHMIPIDWLERSYVKIAFYLYAGELAGDEGIPEGQKFRVKEKTEYTGMVGKMITAKYSEHGDTLRTLELVGEINKSEIYPYFE